MDTKFKERVNAFLAQKNIAFAGYSSEGAEVANHLYDKFEKNGYNVYAVNLKADEVKNVTCYPDLKSIPEKIDAVMISTPPKGTLEVVKQCVELGIKHVWIHKSIGEGSYNKEAVQLAENNDIEIIPMACPMMFLKPDAFHACFKWILNIRGKLKIKEEQKN
ncbi:MAG: CoA-binding protein [Bacteroidales bacterium]|nr:CoA-binding protein [Bacteroidales bacterium]